jgi:hypothetical protein
LSYPGTPFCSSIQPVSAQLVGSNLSGGVFTSSPYGLKIDSITGIITPNLSLPGIYIVNFTKVAKGGCIEVSTSANIEILETPTILISPENPTICINSSVTLTATGASTYTWTPSLGLNTITGANVIASPSSTIEYTVTGTAATGCANGKTITVNVNSVVPLNINASASTNFTCPGTPFNLFTTSLSDTLLASNFNGANQGWTSINSSTNGNVPSSAWTLRPNGYVYTTTSNSNINFQSNDNSSFYLSNSDAQGLGGNTLTTLVSPSLNTLGYASLQLKFYHFYRYSIGSIDRARVEVSIDNINWTTLTTFSSTIGASNSFALSTVDLSSYVGQPSIYIRFRYTGNFAWYWAIDNVSITGTLLGGENNYTWTSIPTGFYSEDKNPTDVSAQENTTYTVIATNQFGCTASSSVAMEVQNIDPVISISDTLICSPNSIEIAVIDTGMYIGGYPLGSTVLWLGYAVGGPATTTINSNLGSTFQAEVTLPNGCTGLSNTINVDTRSIVVNSTVTDANCNLNNGKINVTVSSNPVLPYRYLWKVGNIVLKDTISSSIRDSVNNLNPGNYTLDIYDNFGNSLSCEATTLSFNVNSIMLPQLLLNANSSSCYDANDGSITPTINGGQAPYSYLWSNGSNQPSLFGLSVGLYTLTTTDAYGCSIQDTISVNQPAQILINPMIVNTCIGDNLGSISIDVSNINLPYTTTWYNSNFEFITNGDSIGSLIEGDYNIFIQEDGGANCNILQQFHVYTNPISTNTIFLEGCDSVVVNGIFYAQTGIYIQQLINQFGCDSILTLDLSIKASTSSSTTITSCDSVVWNGVIYYSSGIYTQNFTNAVGCDSVATLDLTINQSSVFYNDLDGDNFGFGVAIFACEQPIQTSTNNQDCDETNSFINPLSSETCENNIDDNCNSVIDENCTFTLNIQLFIEGYYSNGTMAPVLFTNGLSSDSTEVDSIWVELHDQNLPYNKVAEATGILNTDGTLDVNFSSIFQNYAYYIVIRHRNSIQTWSKTPLFLVPFITFEFN